MNRVKRSMRAGLIAGLPCYVLGWLLASELVGAILAFMATYLAYNFKEIGQVSA